jgi:asparagine synthetase B (glutamine-hydrolysing)
LELFESEEKQSLKPLPVHPYDCSEIALRVCSIDGFVVFETNKYSVPYEYVCDIVTLKATEQEIFIYSAFIELIAHHERGPNGACDKHENPAHRMSQKTRYGLEPVREAFTLLGEGADEFIAGLKQKHPHHCGFHAKKILSMKERYNADDIAMACRHALRYRAFDSMAIERILSAKATPRTLESIRNQKAANQLKKVLPEIKQRNLDEYGLFLNRKEYTNEEKGNQSHTKISCDTQSETY